MFFTLCIITSGSQTKLDSKQVGVCLRPRMHVGKHAHVRIHARTDGQTTRKYNASIRPIYWMGKGI